MTNINDYKKRFYNLMESTMGDVKPLINESVDETSINAAITTALNTFAAAYTNMEVMKQKGFKFSFVATQEKGKDGNLMTVWTAYFNNKKLNDISENPASLGSAYIYRRDFVFNPNAVGYIKSMLLEPMMTKLHEIVRKGKGRQIQGSVPTQHQVKLAQPIRKTRCRFIIWFPL